MRIKFFINTPSEQLEETFDDSVCRSQSGAGDCLRDIEEARFCCPSSHTQVLVGEVMLKLLKPFVSKFHFALRRWWWWWCLSVCGLVRCASKSCWSARVRVVTSCHASRNESGMSETEQTVKCIVHDAGGGGC